jgi:acetyl esterase/lipase
MMRSLAFVMIVLFAACAGPRISKHRNITYDRTHNLKLDVFTPRNEIPKATVIFIHGGRWRAGDKSMYRFFGRCMARKGYTAALIDYRSSRKTGFNGMATDAAASVKWVRENIGSYGGTAEKVFLAGHSAGGHLAALIATDTFYFDSLRLAPVDGVILIDAFGLDINRLLQNGPRPKNSFYYKAFTRDSVNWKKASPANHLRDNMPPFLLLVGARTFSFIKEDNFEFFYNLKTYQLNARLKLIKGKGHLAMIMQFRKPWSKVYQEILEFIDN